MLRAKEIAQGQVDVELCTIKHRAESIRPGVGFREMPDIERYAYNAIEELSGSHRPKPLPLLRDIIDPLADNSDADYVVYTNLDIGVFPNFYLLLNSYIEQGVQALCINRRTLPKSVFGVQLNETNLPLIWSLAGDAHEGIDCFVFPRATIRSLDLGNVYIGYPPVGQVLKTQIEKRCDSFFWEKEAKATFHLGDDRAWRGVCDYSQQNLKEASGRYVPCIPKPTPKNRVASSFYTKLKKLTRLRATR